MRYRYTGLIMAGLVGVLSGCATKHPHNDVLIFGTTTKLAADVAAPVQNAGIPEFTIGFKRLEAVWMPLRPNGTIAQAEDNSKIVERSRKVAKAINACITELKSGGMLRQTAEQRCFDSLMPGGLYQGESSGIVSGKGGAVKELDTYSVFASFGGTGSLSFNSASGSLAQFFATGIAAQRLGANPQVGVALNAEAPDAAQAQAEADQAQSEADQAMAEAVSDVQMSDRAFYDKTVSETNLIMACRAPSKDQAQYNQFITDTAANAVPANQARINALQGNTVDDTFAFQLKSRHALRAEFMKQYIKDC